MLQKKALKKHSVVFNVLLPIPLLSFFVKFQYFEKCLLATDSLLSRLRDDVNIL